MRVILGAALLLCGCAMEAVTTDERAELEYRRDVARIEAVERFERLQRICKAAGGALHVTRRLGRLQVDEMKHATCVTRSPLP